MGGEPERWIEPQRPEGGRLWSKALWLFIILACLGIHMLQVASQAGLRAEALAGPEKVQSMELRYASRVSFGISEVLGGSDLSSMAGNPMQLIRDSATGPIETLRAAIVAAAALDDRTTALELLQQAERELVELENDLEPAADEESREQREAWFEAVRQDISDVGVALAQMDASRLDADTLDRLERRHADFGEMVRIIGSPENDPLRQRFVDRGVRTMISAVVLVGTGALAVLIGFGLGIVALILILTGKIRPRLNIQSQWSHRTRTLLLEAFALFLIGFVVVTSLAELIVVAGGPDLSPILIWTLLLMPLWPMLRGMPWRDLHLALGWHANGAGPGGAIKEAFLGVAGYLAGLPIVVLGFLISIVMVGLLHSEPSHPAVTEAMNADLKTAIKLFALASLWAPIVEETVFRGLLYYNMRKWAAPIISALVVAFFFAIIHPQGLALVPALMGLAVVFALMREWRGSIIGPMVAHGMHNAFIITTILLVLGK